MSQSNLLLRPIKKIILHATAVIEGSGQTIKQVRDYHVNVRGYNDIGYHFLVEDLGNIEVGRHIAKRGAHAYGHNDDSVGIAYTGGLSATGSGVAGPNTAQALSLKALVDSLIVVFPTITQVIGHRDTGAKKDCPCFDVETWMETGVVTPSRNLA